MTYLAKVKRHCSKGFAAVTAGAFAMAVPFTAQAQAVDVSSVVSEITAQRTPILAIGAAVFTVLVAASVWKWLRRAT